MTLRRREHRIQQERIARWRAQVATVGKVGSKKSHAYIKGKHLAALHHVQKPDGSVAVMPDEMHEAIRMAWQQIDSPTTTLGPEQSDITFDKYKHCFVDTAWPDEPISSRDLLQALARAKVDTSPGKRAWTVSDIRSLPAMAKIELTQLYRLWDQVGPPLALNEVYVSLIPKTSDSMDPLALRPIAVEPLLIRLWTTIKTRQWATSITQAIPCAQSGGYRAGVPTTSLQTFPLM